MKHDDLSERLQQHGNWLYGIGTPAKPMTAPDFLAAGARIDRLQAEVDALSNAKPLDFNQMHKVTSEAHIAFCLGKFDSFEVALIRHTEKAHGIEEEKT